MRTIERTLHAWQGGVVAARAVELNDRLERRGFERCILVEVGETYWVRDDLGFEEARVDATLIFETPALDGNYELLGIGDFTGEEALTFAFTDGVELGALTRQCDHCGTNRQRNTVFVVLDQDTGERIQVGSTCVRDFLGWNVANVLFFAETVGELNDDWDGDLGDDTIDVELFVAAAWAAQRAYGWARVDQPGSTRDVALDLVHGRRRDEYAEAHRLWGPQAVTAAREAVAWARQIDGGDDFHRNLGAVARHERLGRRQFGIAAYLPVAYDRAMAREAEARAEAERDQDAEEVPNGRGEVTGEVLSVQVRYTDYGEQLKMVVLDDRGFRLWTTVPAAIRTIQDVDGWRELDRGDRVAFTATLTRSNDDAHFGFAKRPTKARLLRTAAQEADVAAALAQQAVQAATGAQEVAAHYHGRVLDAETNAQRRWNQQTRRAAYDKARELYLAAIA